MKVLTFLPSRNLTFPSIIQLLSTIVEGRYYPHCFQVFFSSLCETIPFLNAVYRNTIEHLRNTMNNNTPRRAIFFSLDNNDDSRLRITRQNPYFAPTAPSIHLDNLDLLRALLRSCSLSKPYSAHYPFPCTLVQWRSAYVFHLDEHSSQRRWNRWVPLTMVGA